MEKYIILLVENVLVAGGAGFIGSHLCDLLVKSGHEVTCIDNLITGSDSNIKHLQKKNNFKFVRADVTQISDYKLPATDYIFHLAFSGVTGGLSKSS